MCIFEPVGSNQQPLGERTNVGLISKYIVRKADTGEGVDGCFVLRPGKDLAAVAALRAYAAATDNDVLAADIIDWVGAEPNAPLPLDELREMDGEPVYIHSDTFPGDCGWRVVKKASVLDIQFTDGDCFLFTFYGKSWIAYRRKPQEV